MSAAHTYIDHTRIHTCTNTENNARNTHTLRAVTEYVYKMVDKILFTYEGQRVPGLSSMLYLHLQQSTQFVYEQILHYFETNSVSRFTKAMLPTIYVIFTCFALRGIRFSWTSILYAISARRRRLGCLYFPVFCSAKLFSVRYSSSMYASDRLSMFGFRHARSSRAI